MVVESREQWEGEEGQDLLCDWLLSRTLLRKARLSQNDDAVHYFRRALAHVPGQSLSLYQIFQYFYHSNIVKLILIENCETLILYNSKLQGPFLKLALFKNIKDPKY